LGGLAITTPSFIVPRVGRVGRRQPFFHFK
jgi:hypothetical protein